MERISTFQIAAHPEALRETASESVMAQSLHEPMQALLHAITSRTTAGPMAIYLCSPDDEMRLRVDFASALTRTIVGQIPSTLLVDCDFRSVGLGGIVPEKDALGFLDFLLYGSSLGVITQETTGGLHLIGAGSFPVTKRMPFVLSAFDEASRRLCTHARCVVFAGPMLDDDGETHPLVNACDLAILVRSGEGLRPGVDVTEERMVSNGETDLLSVRVVLPTVPKPEPASVEELEEILPSPMPPVIEPPTPAAEVPPLPGSGSRGAGSGRRWVTALFIVGLALASWWWASREANDVSPVNTAVSPRQSTGMAEPVRPAPDTTTQPSAVSKTAVTSTEVAKKPQKPPVSKPQPQPRTTNTATAA